MNKLFQRGFFVAAFMIALFIPGATDAQSLNEQIYKAKVVEVVSEEVVDGGTLYGSATVQTLEIELLDGNRKGEVLTFANDYIELKKGDRFFFGYVPANEEQEDVYRVIERDRQPILWVFVLLFIGVIVAFGKKQGVRSVLSLAGSMFMLAYVLIPGLLKGVNPVLLSTGIAALILCIAIFFTHGFKRESLVAFIGTVSAVIITGVLSLIAVKLCHFTGLGTEEAWYLNLQSDITLDFSGLLLGGIIIGVLGVLDDIAITQASVVRELYSSAPHLTKRQVYTKALRVGQEHVGALVNTLALAYTGASLPLLLLFSTSLYPFRVLISQEMFSVEIIRTIVGSIGLVLTVPITTALAVYMLEQYRGKEYDHGHSHSHGHSH